MRKAMRTAKNKDKKVESQSRSRGFWQVLLGPRAVYTGQGLAGVFLLRKTERNLEVRTEMRK